MDEDLLRASVSAEADLVEWRLYLEAGEDTQAALRACQAHVQPLLRDYIWQREAFSLEVLQESCGPCLGGAAHVGDSVEDEWFLTWLLLDLTRARPGLSVRVWDADGEFLLIEAAFALPKWARKPEATQFRVFLRSGQLHLVRPLRGDGPDWSLLDGLRALLSRSEEETLAPAAVRERVACALCGFPQRAAAHAHCAHARVPSRVAALLQAEPQMVALAVQAFYERDPGDVRSAARMAWFPYSQLATVRVRFTRVLYAQLAQQRFDPPRGAPQLPAEGHPGYRAASLGVKLTAGFEMLAADWARAGTPLPAPQDDAPSAPSPGACATSSGGSAAERAACILRRRDPGLSARDIEAASGGADDDESWLSEGEALLERALREREEERRAHECRRDATRRAAAAAADAEAAAPDGDGAAAQQVGQVVRGVRAFLDGLGTEEGASGGGRSRGGAHQEGLAVNPSRFLRELSGALGLHWQPPQRAEGSSDDDHSSDASEDLSDDFDVDTDEEEEEEEEGRDARAHTRAEGAPGDWRRYSAAAGSGDSDDQSCSDDHSSRGFHEEYSAALDAQLRDTSMRDDFTRGAAEEAEGKAGEESDVDAHLPPVDVDLNLVQSLLASYSAQQGLPGPASNLLGALGLALPEDTDRETGR